jgi:phosphopantothenate-cysteine ligase
MRPLGSKSLFYLAAAVSDFFVPRDRMVEHKIQSSDAAASHSRNAEVFREETDLESDVSVTSVQSKKLVVDLDPVPKFLKRLVDGWAPEGMIVSFKLETDPSILVSKAHYSLNRYSHHLVIGNLLSTRKWEVVFVSPDSPDRWIRVPKHQRTKSLSGSEAQVGLAALRSGNVEYNTAEQPGYLRAGESLEIESLIVPEVVKMHTAMIERAKGRSKETINEGRRG